MSDVSQMKAELKALGSPEKAREASRFFKTGPGQYGEGDVFIGVTVPEIRAVAKRYLDLPLHDVEELIMSSIHEERLTALIVLVYQFGKGSEATKKAIYDFYMTHTAYINNWDLVDTSAEFIVGPWLADKDKTVLGQLAHSELVWDRRIAMLATFDYIKQGDPTDALTIVTLLLEDQHDLIQKAVGWMLREIGKRCSEKAEKEYLQKHYKTMSRTTLRYAIERFPKEVREAYLSGSI